MFVAATHVDVLAFFCTTGEVMYWDLVEAEVVRSFQAHTGVVCSMAMHPEGTSLLTSSLDGIVKVWGAA